MVIVKSPLFGGEGGSPFNESGNRIARIERIVVHYGQFVTRLDVSYVLDTSERLSTSYGALEGAKTAEITLGDDERICAIGVRSGQYVDSLTFVTYRLFNLVGMKQYGPFGGPGGQGVTVMSPNIRGFFGRAGDMLDAIGFRCEDPMLVI